MIHLNLHKALHGSQGEMPLDIALSIEENSFVCISGESGSGKTTLLRILAGLDNAQGTISVNDEIWLDKTKNLSVQKRDIGFVFQDYSLFPNMSVADNLLYVNKDIKLMQHLLEITELSALQKRLPNTLSGGQQQRVSLCRALMNKPKILLMDEPFSALNPQMRTKLQDEILSLHKEFHTTTIMVTHDPSEMYKLANRVVVLHQGKIINDGLPKDVLLKTNGSAKFSFEGKVLDIRKVDVIYTAIIAIGQQLVEIVISYDEAKKLTIGDIINISTKAFSPTISYE